MASRQDRTAMRDIIDLTNDSDEEKKVDDVDEISTQNIMRNTARLTSQSPLSAYQNKISSKSAVKKSPLHSLRDAPTSATSNIESPRSQLSADMPVTPSPLKRLRHVESVEIRALRDLNLIQSGLWDELKNCYGWYMSTKDEYSLVFPETIGNILQPRCAFVHPDAVDRWIKRRGERNVSQKQRIHLKHKTDYIFCEDINDYKNLINYLIDSGHLVYDKQGLDSRGNKKIWKIAGFQRCTSSSDARNVRQKQSSPDPHNTRKKSHNGQRKSKNSAYAELRKLNLQRDGVWNELVEKFGWYFSRKNEPMTVLLTGPLSHSTAYVHPNAVQRWFQRKKERDPQVKQSIWLIENEDYITAPFDQIQGALLDYLIDNDHLVFNSELDKRKTGRIWKLQGFTPVHAKENMEESDDSSELVSQDTASDDDSLESNSQQQEEKEEDHDTAAKTEETNSDSSSELNSYYSTREIPVVSNSIRKPVAKSTIPNLSNFRSERTKRLSRESQVPNEAKLRKLGFISDGIWIKLTSKYGWYLAKFKEPRSFYATDQERKLAYTRAIVHPSAVDRWKQRCAEKDDARKDEIVLIPNLDYFNNPTCMDDVMNFLIKNQHLQLKSDGKWEIVGFPEVLTSNAREEDEGDDNDNDDENDAEVSAENATSASPRGFDLFRHMMERHFDPSSSMFMKNLWRKNKDDLEAALRVLWCGFQAEDREVFENADALGKNAAHKQATRLVETYVRVYKEHSRNVIPTRGKSMLVQAKQVVQLREKYLNETFQSTQMVVAATSSSDSSDSVSSSQEDDHQWREEPSRHNSSRAMKRKPVWNSNDDESDDEDGLNPPPKSAIGVSGKKRLSSMSRQPQPPPPPQIKRRVISNVAVVQPKEHKNVKLESKNVPEAISASSLTASTASDTSKDGHSSTSPAVSVAVAQSKFCLTPKQSASASTGASSSSSSSLISQSTFSTSLTSQMSEVTHLPENIEQIAPVPPTAAAKQPLLASIYASPSAVSNTSINETLPLSSCSDNVIKPVPVVVTTVSKETVTPVALQLSQNSSSSSSSSSFVQEKKKPAVSKKYLQELAEADRQVGIWIEHARQDLAANQKPDMSKLWSNIRGFGSKMEEFRWQTLSVNSALSKVIPERNTAYFAPWASRGGELPKHKSGINIDELVRDRDYFFTNDDVYKYLLKHGHKFIDQNQIKSDIDRLPLQDVGGTSAAMLTTRRCHPLSDLYSSLALEGFVFPSSTSSGATVENSDPNSSIYSIYLMRKVRLFQPKNSSSGSSSPRYTHRDGTCICYKPPAIVPVPITEFDDDADSNSSEPDDDVYTGAKWAVVLDDKRSIEKLDIQEVMLAIEDFNCKNTKPRRIFKPQPTESKVNNKVKSIKLESADIVINHDRDDREQLRLRQRIEELETEVKQYIEKLQLKDAEAQTSAMEAQHWADQQINERKREVHEHSKEIKRLQKSLQSAKADIHEKANIIDSLKSQITQQEVDFSNKIEAERLKHLNELRTTREHERKRFLHEQAHLNQANSPVASSSSSSSSTSSAVALRRSATKQVNDLSVGDDGHDPVKQWETYRGCLMLAAAVEMVEIIKPVNPIDTLSSSTEDAAALSVECEYPVAREIIENLSRIGGYGSSSSSIERQPRTRVKRVANDAIDAGGLVTEWMDDYMEKMQTFCINVDSLAPNRASSSESLGVNDGDGDNPLFPLFSCLGNAKHFLPSRFSTYEIVSVDNGIIKECMSPISLSVAPKTKEAAAQQKALATAYETFGKVLNQMIRQEIPILEAFSSILLVSYLLEDSLEAIKNRKDITLKNWHDFLVGVDYDTFGYEESPIAQNIATILETEPPERAKHRLFDEYITEYIIMPRLEALTCIKKGFDMFNIKHLLREIPIDSFVKCFFSNAFINPSQILQALVFPESEMLASASHARFQKVIKEAVSKMKSQDCSNFLKFATGSGSFQAKIKIKVVPQIQFHQASESPGALCLSATSLTCSNQLTIPYPFAAAAAAASVAANGACSWYDAEYVLTMLKESFVNGLKSDFFDNL